MREDAKEAIYQQNNEQRYSQIDGNTTSLASSNRASVDLHGLYVQEAIEKV